MIVRSKKQAEAIWKKFYKKSSAALLASAANVVQLKTKGMTKLAVLSSFAKSSLIDMLSTKCEYSSTIKKGRGKQKTLPAAKQKKLEPCKKLDQENNKKLQLLLDRINHADWYHKIFADKNILQLAKILLIKERISPQQFCSIRERAKMKNIKNLLVYAILDTQEEYSKEAIEILFPALRTKYYLKKPSNEQMDQFKLLIATLPCSEQYFYYFRIVTEPNNISHSMIIENHTKHSVTLTQGAQDALGIVRFGLDEYLVTLNFER